MTDNTKKPFSIAFGGNKLKPSLKPTTVKKRPHSALADPDSDHEEHAEPQLVTSFDHSAGGAISATKTPEKTPLIIKAQRNRDWREESRRKRRKNLLPAEVQAAENGTNGLAQNGMIEKDEISKEAGLKFVKAEKNDDVVMVNGPSTNGEDNSGQETEQTADEEAIQALLGKEKKSNLVIPTANGSYEGANGEQPLQDDYSDEDDRFKADVASRPNSCTLDEYARIPVEDFGSAMLRGMGWKEGQVVGKSNEKSRAPRTVERRPALLGIGAKEVPGNDLEALGAWGKAAKTKKKRVDMAYSPVLLKNQKTGEMLTEEELEKKKLEAGNKAKGEEDWRDRRDKNLAVDREKKMERLTIEDGRNGDYKRRERSRSRERRHHKDSRRQRSRSKDRNTHSSSRIDRSRSSDRSRHSSRRDRSRSREKHGRERHHDDYDRRHKDRSRPEKDYRRR